MRLPLGGTNDGQARLHDLTMAATATRTPPAQRQPGIPDNTAKRVRRPELDRIASIYRAHSPMVWRVLRRCGIADADLDDAVQETFLVVVRRLDDFDGRAAITTWLYAVAVRVASTLQRSRRREAARRLRAGEDMHGNAMFDPEAELSRAQDAALIDRLLDELDESKRIVFVLAELEGLPAPEISRILGVNVRTVHSRLRLARQRFRMVLHRDRVRVDGRTSRARWAARRPCDDAGDRATTRRRNAVLSGLFLDVEGGRLPLSPGWTQWAVSPLQAASSLFTPLLVLPAAIVVAITSVGALRSEPSTRPLEELRLPTVRSGVDAWTTRARPPTMRRSPVLDPTPTVPRRDTSRPTTRVREPSPLSAEASREAESTLAAETRLLERARSALRAGDPGKALHLLDRYDGQFPTGLLADEARSSRIRALCRLEREQEARALASSSRWHAVVTTACKNPDPSTSP